MAENKIVYIIEQLDRGGAEQQLYLLLSNIKFDVTVISLTQGGYWAEPIRQLGHKVIELDPRKKTRLHRLWELGLLLRKLNPNIIHLFLDSVTGIYTRIAALFFRNSTFFVSERGDPERHPVWYRILIRLTNSYVSRVICNSYTTQKRLSNLGLVSQGQTITIPNGIDYKKFAEANRLDYDWSSHPERPKFVVGFVGHLSQVKNPLAFVRIADSVHHHRDDVHFVMVGGGSLHQEIQQYIKAKGLEHVVYVLGERTDIPGILQNFDIFLLTSKQEGMPNALLEAMASGLPCIVTDAGDCRRIVEGANAGYVFTYEDEDGMANCLLNLLDNPELQAALGKASQDYSTRFEISAMAEQHLALYHQAFSRREDKR